MKFKFLAKIAAPLLAASVIAASFPYAAFAESGGDSPAATQPSQPTQPSDPSLSSGASSGGYTTSFKSISENNTVNINALIYIPISNFTGGLDAWDVVNENNVFAYAVSNESFTLTDTSAIITNPEIVGSFLHVTAMFSGVTYTGKGRSFTYNVCYNSAGQSITVPITISLSECVETNAAPDPTDPSAAKFALANSNTYIIKAGTNGTLSVDLKNVNGGTFENVAASLASADGNVIVETVETQTSTSSRPRFSFRISAPARLPREYII